MSDRKRQLRKLLERYRDRAAAITLEMPELKALAERDAAPAVAEAAAPAVVEVAAAAPATVRPAPVAERTPPPASMPAPAPAPAPAARRPAPAPRPDEDDPAPREGYSLGAWLAAALVAALAGGGWVAVKSVQRKNSHRAHALPLESAVGLARRGIVLYSYDRDKARMAAIDSTTGGVISLKRFPNASASGLAASPDKLWSADANGFLYEHALTDDYAVRRTFANPNRRPSALHWDGSRLWIADARTNTLYEYTVGSSLVPARQFTLPPGMTPVGLHVANGLVWVLDANSRAIYRYRVRALLEPVDSVSLQARIAAPRRPAGFVVDDRALWITTDGPPELHRLELRSLDWRSDD